MSTGAESSDMATKAGLDELWQLSAHALVDGYRRGNFSPTDALESVLARCDVINPMINAVIARDDAAARKMAQDSSARWATGAPLSALDGVPVSIKDNLVMSGLPATWGLPGLAGNIPDHDEVPVARLRAGGAVLFAKTNVPELTVQGYTDNRIYGATGLPFAPDLTPGGSSGGAVAAVAAGIGPLALCTDGGGSIRRPAAHGGVFGLKPGAGRIRRGNGFPPILGAFEVVGPIARDPQDLEAAFHWLSNTDASDPVPTGAARVLYARSFSHQPVDPIVLQMCDTAAARLTALGHNVTVIDSFDSVEETDAIWPVISSSGVAWFAQKNPKLADTFGENGRALAAAGKAYSASDYARAMAAIETMRSQYTEEMAGFDFLMTPAIAALSWPKSETHPPKIDGQEVGPRGHAVFTAFANALGLPAITLPIAPPAGGLPCGVQLVGATGDEGALIQMAKRWQDTSVDQFG